VLSADPLAGYGGIMPELAARPGSDLRVEAFVDLLHWVPGAVTAGGHISADRRAYVADPAGTGYPDIGHGRATHSRVAEIPPRVTPVLPR
jgi:hypothetical protein